MKTLLTILLLASTVQAAELQLDRVAPDTVVVSVTGNIAAYNFTLVGAELVNAQYIGQADKEADYHNNNVIVYGLNQDEVGEGKNLQLTIERSFKPIGITNEAAATAQAVSEQVVTGSLDNTKTASRSGRKTTISKR
jgi:hypothetical protein